jgi:hypothetical protein
MPTNFRGKKILDSYSDRFTETVDKIHAIKQQLHTEEFSRKKTGKNLGFLLESDRRNRGSFSLEFSRLAILLNFQPKSHSHISSDFPASPNSGI